jgi:DNA-binding transcriptional LysR family regulator
MPISSTSWDCGWMSQRVPSHPMTGRPKRTASYTSLAAAKMGPKPRSLIFKGSAVAHALETAGRAWRIAYSSPNLAGIQAAVSVGLGVSILPDVAVLKDHRMLTRKDGFPPVANTELALLMAHDVTSGTRRLADLLAKFCGISAVRDADGTQFPRQRRAAIA